MADPFLTDYDSLLQAILTDYKNQFLANGQILDTSQGSLVFIKAAVTAGTLIPVYHLHPFHNLQHRHLCLDGRLVR